jgi:thioredoxin reductase (NADPH)
VIATGARYRTIELPDHAGLAPSCVYYAATEAEAQMCVSDVVAVVGGGNSAGQATIFLARRALKVHLLIRDELGGEMSSYLVDQVTSNHAVEIHEHTELTDLIGHDEQLEEIVLQDTRNGEQRRLEARYVFVFIGAEPHTSWLGEAVALDENGYVLTGREAEPQAGEHGHELMMLETSLPGVFAAGDVRHGAIKRVASAVGEGAMAVRMVHEHFAAIGESPPALHDVMRRDGLTPAAT